MRRPARLGRFGCLALVCAALALVLLVLGLFLVLMFAGDSHETKLARWSLRPHSPSEVLERFYAYQGAEDQLLDPLLLGGRDVIPAVDAAVADPNMPRREYALIFLGISGAPASVVVLERIARAPSESPWPRVSALEALYRIDPDHAGRVAQELLDGELIVSQDEQDLAELRERLRAMALRTFAPKWTRSWFDALRGAHD